MNRSSFIFKENHVFIEEENKPSEKVVTVDEELDGTGNLVDLTTIIHKIFETNSNFHVKWHTTGKV